MKKQKNIIITIIIVLSIGLLYWLRRELSVGSYPNAEKYIINDNEKDVKKAILEFKQNNKEYLVPKASINNQGAWDLLDEPKGDPQHWFGFYFYYKNENKIVFTLTRSTGKNKTEFFFVATNKGLNIGNWKDINKDFDSYENKIEKEKFEKEILKGIQNELSILKNKKESGF